ncbi:MAG: hypothetical protein NC213_08125 [Acetobacter sp.]|nr:hypothetical protein [Bacteroides sp.]MCM1341696.1 hypothetical protein [Acetobacter sp.]MCM1432366.1 hypothetical protein [Clostridiales bacterium]
MDKEKYLEILDTFIPSVEMQKYLADIKLNNKQISSIILGAPVSLETKLKWTTDNKHNEIKQALDALKLNNDEHFYLFDNWYDDEFGYEEFPNRPFYDFNSVLEHIRGEIAECWEYYDETNWYTLKKMVQFKSKTKHKTNRCVYKYILIKDEVCYFTKYFYTNNALQAPDYRFSESIDLNLPVPFTVGDIVNIDCRPFAPVKQVEITEIGDNHDCYSLVAEYFDKKDKKYKTCAVKNCFIFSNGYQPDLSPLYRISKVN